MTADHDRLKTYSSENARRRPDYTTGNVTMGYQLIGLNVNFPLRDLKIMSPIHNRVAYAHCCGGSY